MSFTVYKTAERPDLQIWWFDDNGNLIDFSTGYTFSFKLGSPGTAATFTKTTNILGATGAGSEPSGTPNITLTFTAGELANVEPGVYVWQLIATSATLDRVFQDTIEIRDVIT